MRGPYSRFSLRGKRKKVTDHRERGPRERRELDFARAYLHVRTRGTRAEYARASSPCASAARAEVWQPGGKHNVTSLSSTERPRRVVFAPFRDAPNFLPIRSPPRRFR